MQQGRFESRHDQAYQRQQYQREGHRPNQTPPTQQQQNDGTDDVFDSNSASYFTRLEPGYHEAIITSSCFKVNKNRNGRYVETVFNTGGRDFTHRANVDHPNATAVAIGKSDMKKLYVCAFGRDDRLPVSKLIGRKVFILLEPKLSDSGKEYLEITDFANQPREYVRKDPVAREQKNRNMPLREPNGYDFDGATTYYNDEGSFT